MADTPSRHHRENVVNFIEDGSHIDTDRDVADTAMKYWDLGSPIDVNVSNDLAVNLDDSEDSVKVGDGTETLGITGSNEALTAVNADNVGLFKDSSFTETRQITDVSTGGTQSNNLLVAVNQSLPAGSNNIGSFNIADIATGGTQTDNLLVDIAAQSLSTIATEQQNNAEAYHNAASITGSGTLTATLDAVGAERLEGQVQSSGSYDVRLDWKDDQGNVIRQETIATGVVGGTWTDISQASKSPHIDVVVVENSGNSQTVDATLHLR